jgi:CRISPR-associated protein Csm1
LGIGETKSLSRLAALSRVTDLFFSGWVHQTLAHPPPGTGYDRIYTVYSGGDDLCLVGPWDVLIDFTRHLAAEFRRYVAGNPNVTLSAAVAVTKPKFPIATSARVARDRLEGAKNAGRNRLSLFGVITRWSEEPDAWVDLNQETEKQLEQQGRHAALLLDQLWPWAELLDEELRRWREARPARYPVSTGFAHRLLGYAEMARTWEQEERISAEDMLYLARLAYDLGRNVVKSDAVPEKTKRGLAQLTQLSNREVMAGMRLPITYALYRNRERSRER